MAQNRKDANQRVLAETQEVQGQTKDAIDRIKQQTAETEEIGNQTLEQLRAQGNQIDDITNDIDTVSNKLDEAQKLQNTFDVWGGSIFGFGKKKAQNAAAAEIALRQQEELMNVKEVFEQQKYESLKSNWKAVNFALCSNPTIEAPELFVPSVQQSIPNSSWKVDFSLSGIDGDGWTYAYDFASLNKVSPINIVWHLWNPIACFLISHFSFLISHFSFLISHMCTCFIVFVFRLVWERARRSGIPMCAGASGSILSQALAPLLKLPSKFT